MHCGLPQVDVSTIALHLLPPEAAAAAEPLSRCFKQQPVSAAAPARAIAAGGDGGQGLRADQKLTRTAAAAAGAQKVVEPSGVFWGQLPSVARASAGVGRKEQKGSGGALFMRGRGSSDGAGAGAGAAVANGLGRSPAEVEPIAALASPGGLKPAAVERSRLTAGGAAAITSAAAAAGGVGLSRAEAAAQAAAATLAEAAASLAEAAGNPTATTLAHVAATALAIMRAEAAAKEAAAAAAGGMESSAGAPPGACKVPPLAAGGRAMLLAADPLPPAAAVEAGGAKATTVPCFSVKPTPLPAETAIVKAAAADGMLGDIDQTGAAELPLVVAAAAVHGGSVHCLREQLEAAVREAKAGEEPFCSLHAAAAAAGADESADGVICAVALAHSNAVAAEMTGKGALVDGIAGSKLGMAVKVMGTRESPAAAQNAGVQDVASRDMKEPAAAVATIGSAAMGAEVDEGSGPSGQAVGGNVAGGKSEGPVAARGRADDMEGVEAAVATATAAAPPAGGAREAGGGGNGNGLGTAAGGVRVASREGRGKAAAAGQSR